MKGNVKREETPSARLMGSCRRAYAVYEVPLSASFIFIYFFPAKIVLSDWSSVLFGSPFPETDRSAVTAVRGRPDGDRRPPSRASPSSSGSRIRDLRRASSGFIARADEWDSTTGVPRPSLQQNTITSIPPYATALTGNGLTSKIGTSRRTTLGAFEREGRFARRAGNRSDRALSRRETPEADFCAKARQTSRPASVFPQPCRSVNLTSFSPFLDRAVLAALACRRRGSVV